MNKTLMGASVLALSSAQVSVAQAAEWDLDWGGFFNSDLAFSSEDNNDSTDGFDVLTNAEIIFTPSITLDNGLTFGARVEYEADPATSNNTDEAWAFVKGSFGEIRVGAEDSPYGAMMTGAPSYMAGVTSGTFTGTYLPSSYGAGANASQIQGDAQKIVYYTPRFSGFQVGVSYARARNKDDRRWEESEDLFSIGANYDTSFGSTSVTLAATYETCGDCGTSAVAAIPGVAGVAAVPGTAAVDGLRFLPTLNGGTFLPGATTGPNQVQVVAPAAATPGTPAVAAVPGTAAIPGTDGPGDRFSLGAQFGFGGFTVGGGYANVEDTYDFYNLGVGYESGPWGVALSGGFTEPDGGGDDVTVISLNGKYDLGPGVKARGYIGYAEAGDLEGFGIGTGIALSF